MKSIGAQIKQIAGLLGTRDVTAWEQRFIEDMVVKTNNGDLTVHLSPGQCEKIESIFEKHFAA